MDVHFFLFLDIETVVFFSSFGFTKFGLNLLIVIIFTSNDYCDIFQKLVDDEKLAVNFICYQIFLLS